MAMDLDLLNDKGVFSYLILSFATMLTGLRLEPRDAHAAAFVPSPYAPGFCGGCITAKHHEMMLSDAGEG